MARCVRVLQEAIPVAVASTCHAPDVFLDDQEQVEACVEERKAKRRKLLASMQNERKGRRNKQALLNMGRRPWNILSPPSSLQVDGEETGDREAWKSALGVIAEKKFSSTAEDYNAFRERIEVCRSIAVAAQQDSTVRGLPSFADFARLLSRLSMTAKCWRFFSS